MFQFNGDINRIIPTPVFSIFKLTIQTAFAVIAALTVAASSAQDARPAPSEEARAFDFWIGDWKIEQEILQKDGTWLTLEASTSVAPALNGRALIEHWEGKVQFFWEGMKEPEPMKGLSVRAYDPQTRKWYIHWMDTRRPYFGTAYSGGFSDGEGEFFRKWEIPDGKRTGRIRFFHIRPDSVDWDLAISKGDGKTWSTLWRMHMRRVKS